MNINQPHSTEGFQTGQEDLEIFVDDVLHDFQEQFAVPDDKSAFLEAEKLSKSIESRPSIAQTPATLSIRDVAEDPYSPEARLIRIEKRIAELNNAQPEYVEERVALEEKKNRIKEETLSGNTPNNSFSREDQKKIVEDLLKRKFSYIAPIMSPEEEERIRTERAKEAEHVDQVRPPTTAARMPEIDRLHEASRMREEFIQGLQDTSAAVWYESPSKNRDAVSQYVYKTAEFLTGKRASDVDMNDVQTARLFLFNNAPETTLNHPAYKYVESFYNYQNKRGFSGKDIEAESK